MIRQYCTIMTWDGAILHDCGTFGNVWTRDIKGRSLRRTFFFSSRPLPLLLFSLSWWTTNSVCPLSLWISEQPLFGVNNQLIPCARWACESIYYYTVSLLLWFIVLWYWTWIKLIVKKLLCVYLLPGYTKLNYHWTELLVRLAPGNILNRNCVRLLY